MIRFRHSYFATETAETRTEAAKFARDLRNLRFSGNKPSNESVRDAVLMAFLPK